jgi:uncharacterized membrane protein
MSHPVGETFGEPWEFPRIEMLIYFGLEQFTIGAIIGRLSRPVGPSVALAYAATLAALNMVTIAWIMFDDVFRDGRLWAVSNSVSANSVAVVTAVLGAVWAAGSRPDRCSQRS